MLVRAIVAALALGGAAVAAPASAAKYVITYTGFVNAGYDKTGEFGAANTDLTGLPYKAVYHLTTPLPPGVLTYTSYTLSWFNAVGSVARPLTAELTINGIAKSLEGSWYSEAYQAFYNNGGDIEAQVGDFASAGNVLSSSALVSRLYSEANKFVTTSNYTDPLDYTVQPGDINNISYFFFNTYDFDYWYDPDKALVHSAHGDLTVQHVTINAAAAPEPASWAMMIAGFGLIGAAMRRRTNSTASTLI